MLLRLRPSSSLSCLAVLLLPLAAFLSQPCPLPAQQGTAQRETQRRMAQSGEAETLAAEGDAAIADGRVSDAVSQYSAALQRLAPGATALAATRQSVVQRFADASVSLAREQAGRGEFSKARNTLQAALADNAFPGYPPAKTLLKQLDDPDFFNPAQTPRHAKATKKVRDLFILAEGMVELGDYQAARKAYQQILGVDEYNTAARLGLERVENNTRNYLRASRDHTHASMLNEVDRQWETTVPAASRVPGTLQPGETPGGGEIAASARQKAQTLMLDRVAMSDSPLVEALDYLAKKSQEVDTLEPDPNLKGVNIVFNPAGKSASEFKTVTIDLRSVSLGEALRSITDLTLTRLNFQGNTITVSPLGSNSRMLLRSFRVPPGFLSKAGSAKADAGASTDPFGADSATIQTGLKISRMNAKDWLVENGIPFPEGTSADYSPGTNQLMVRNTEENLDRVQTAVENATDKTQRQVQVNVVLLKAEEKRLQELNFDWLIGASSVAGSGIYASGGTVGNAANPAQVGDYSFIAPNGTAVGGNPVTAGLRGALDLKSSPSIDDLIAGGTAGGGLTNGRSPGIFGVGGVFTSPQFQSVMRGLDQKKGIDISIGQTIILKAGQRATAGSTRTILYPTEFDPPQIPQTIAGPSTLILGNGVGISGNLSGTPPVTPTTPQSFEPRETGSTIEVEATVGDDGVTVDLNLSVIFREFDGFLNFGTPITSNGLVLTDNKIFQPVFSAINESAQVLIYDGSTIAIGGLSASKYESINDKVPLLGDLPFIGRFFRSDVTQVSRKAAIYFVTVKVIDPGGLGIQQNAANAEAAAAEVPEEP